MNVTALSQLVFGADRPDQMLLANGRLPDGWSQEYFSTLNAGLAACGPDCWPHSLIQAAHWASFYLPIRYHAAARFGFQSINTLQELRQITFQTETSLFANLLESTSNAMHVLSESTHQTDAQSRLVHFTFGLGNPVTTIKEGGVLEHWRDSFIKAWLELTAKLQAADFWPKWPVMAGRFASFYWDLWLTQCVQLEDNPAVIVDGSSVLPSPTLALMKLMLGRDALEVGDDGLPEIGPVNANAKFSVRRIVEVTLTDKATQTVMIL